MLLKFRLSFLVVFSGAFGYFLALDTEVNWVRFIAFVIGSFLITGSANTINQIIEKETDKLMKRTANRPLPTGRLSVSEATTFAILLALVGSVLIASFVNVFSACLSLFSLILYAFVYTPLKPKTPFAVLVGAFPGALPPLIGWVAASGSISMEAMIIFSIQFIWQFPHFWAIAWVANDDYTNAGFRLLPSEGGRNFNSAFQIMIYTMFLIPLGLLPSRFGIVGISSGIIATICGILFLFQTFYLLREGTVKSAMRLMFGSFIYLPVVQIAYLIDKL
ncbi:MAG: heme o synthase [Thermoflexibacter sp.]|nr:heme o synthase [Thermoflexibacter sp.]